MIALNDTSGAIGSSSEVIGEFSSIFSGVVNYIVDWFTRISWFEWLILLFILIMIFVLLYLKGKVKEKTRRYRF